ncbi:MAG: ATPase domain-containing protein [Actinomycetota bacterium]
MTARATTGIADLDVVLGGGFPAGSCVVFGGAPGTGKTILAQQVCFANATAERKAVYYTTLSEPHSKLVEHLEGFSFFDSTAVGEIVQFHSLAALADRGGSGDVSMAAVATEVVREAFEERPSVIVIDSSKALHEGEGAGFRRAVYELASRVAHTDAVLILVGEYDEDDMRTAAEFAVADAIILLSNATSGMVDRRWLRVAKLRGSDYLGGRHSFRIGPSGMELYPRVESTLPEPVSVTDRRLKSGVPGLDEMMTGGFPSGSATIIAGPSGAGKTVMCLQFIAEGLKAGESCVFASYQESRPQILAKAAHFGWDLEKNVNDGSLVIVDVQPVELGLDAIAAQIRQAVSSTGALRVVIDSISELERADDNGRFADYLWALVHAIRRDGATCLLTSETSAFFGPAFELAHGLSYIADNILLLRYTELESEIRRALVVVKMRDSDHIKSLVEFEITNAGAVVKGKFAGVSGVLSGSPTPTEQKFKEFFGR